jgi:FkbM family methyltransferase
MRLFELKEQGFNPETILDIGAHEGWFYDLSNSVWPSAECFMIEANEHMESTLKEKSNKYLITLLGDEEKEVDYYMGGGLTNTGHSIYLEDTPYYTGESLIVVKKQMTKLDTIFENDSKFDLIKLDTQGSELDILSGGEKLCKQAKVIILEVSYVEYNKGAPLHDEVVEFMDKFGFKKWTSIGEHYPPTGTKFEGVIQEDIVFINKEYAE